MIHEIAILNTFLWIVLAIVLFIGFITYADYYTKKEEFCQVYLILFGIAMFLGGMAFLVAATQDGLNAGIRFSSMVFSFVTSLYYIVFVCGGVIAGFIELRKYYGTKRGKI